MRPLLLILLSLLLGSLTSTAAAQCEGVQQVGAFPRMTFRDGMGQSAPAPGDPFDSSSTLSIFGGQVIELDLQYEAVGDPTNVIWAMLLSPFQTGTSTTDFCGLPGDPPLFTAAPFNVFFFSPPMLDATGAGTATFNVPTGIYAGDAFVQGIILDPNNAPNTHLSNGVTISFTVPGFNVSYAFALNQPGQPGRMKDLGVIDVTPEEGKELLPFGTMLPPMPEPFDPGTGLGVFEFLDILPNRPDWPMNPLARPIARLTQEYNQVGDTTFAVDSTEFFPKRGRLSVTLDADPAGTSAPTSRNHWANKVGSGTSGPNVEVVFYEDITATSFSGLERLAEGTKGILAGTQAHHIPGDIALGDFSMVTSPAAKSRERVALDASNRDMPHVVIPAFSFTPEGADGEVTLDLDVFLFENTLNDSQGFLVLDRVTNVWRFIEGSARNPAVGRWSPWVMIAPDGRSMIATLRPPDGNFNWDHDADQLWAMRLDGEVWGPTGEETWQLTYELFPSPTGGGTRFIRSRKVIPQASFIIGEDPDNYVAYIGLGYKFQQNLFPAAGNNNATDPDDPQSYLAFEASNPREEAIVRDYVAVPLVSPSSGKPAPVQPTPLMLGDFGQTGFEEDIIRFDPAVLVDSESRQAIVVGGHALSKEDVFVVKSATSPVVGGVTTVSHVLVNATGHRDTSESAGQLSDVAIRGAVPGGHGQGGKMAFSPGGTRIAVLAIGNSGTDWIQVARTDGIDFGKVLNVGQSLVDGKFREGPIGGPLQTARAVMGMVFAGEDDLVFLMGRQTYNDPLAEHAAVGVDVSGAMDIFRYDIVNDELTNLTQLGGTAFETLGTFEPGGYFQSSDGNFVYYIRRGEVGPGGSQPEGTVVTNIIGVNLTTFAVFDVTGGELGSGALVSDLFVDEGSAEHPIESINTMGFIEGKGVQEGMVYYKAQVLGGNGAENVYALNTGAPFVSFAVTNATIPGALVRNLSPNAFGAQVAFSRSMNATPLTNNERPFVVDLTNFLFERQLLTEFPPGRLMDGGFIFLPPTTGAPQALVMAFGFNTIGPFAIANEGAVTYYPLTNVSDLLTEPVPLHLPLVDTLLLPLDTRFYLANAIPFPGAP